MAAFAVCGPRAGSVNRSTLTGQKLSAVSRLQASHRRGLGAVFPQPARVCAKPGDGNQGNEGMEDGEESKRVQDTLEQIVQLQVGQERLKAKVIEATGTLEEAAEQVKNEIELSRQKERARAEESYMEAMEEIERMSREAAEDLDANAAFKSNQDEEELEAWESKMEQDRSEGQFFKRLYVDESRKKRPPASMTTKEMKAKAAEVRAEINKELRNPFRLVTYGFLTAVLLIAALDDALTSAPSWGRIALYLAIAGVCGFNGYKEAKYLEEQADELDR